MPLLLVPLVGLQSAWARPARRGTSARAHAPACWVVERGEPGKTLIGMDVGNCSAVPRAKDVDAPSLAVFKARSDGALSKLV